MMTEIQINKPDGFIKILYGNSHCGEPRSTASPKNHHFFLSAPVLKLFIVTPDIWGNHQEPKKDFFSVN